MKCDITVSKKFTINTGNYSSIQPNISLTTKDVNIEKIEKVHSLLSVIADGLFHLQIIDDGTNMASIKKMGVGKYLRKLNQDEIQTAIEDSLRELINVEEKF